VTARRQHVAPDSEGGAVLVLGIGVVAVALLIVAAVVDASRLFLTRQSVASVADGAALRAAQDIDLPALYAMGPRSGVRLALGEATRDVTAYVARQARSTRLASLRVQSVRVRGSTVEVTLTALVRLPLSGVVLGHPDGVRVTATAAAELAVAG